MSLQYNSWNELQKACELTKDVRDSLNVLSGPSTYKQLVSMTKKAAEHEREGKLDLALVMTRRAAEVCDILKQKPGFTSTSRTPEAREFYKIFSDIIRQAESLRNRVKPFLEVAQVTSTLDSSTSSYSRTSSSSSYSRRDSTGYAADKSSSPYSMASGLSRMTTDDTPVAVKPTKQETPSVFVRALDVVNAVEKEHKTALFIDFRENKNKRIQYQNEKSDIKVLSVDPLILMPGCSITSLFESLDLANRSILWALDKYDLVILVGDEQRSRIEDYSPKSVTLSLIGALTTHNSLRLLPKTLHLLADGFRGWEMTYPMYVSSSQPARRRILDDNSEFSILVANAREATAVDADYPDLFASRKPPTAYDSSTISRRTPSPTMRRPSSGLAMNDTAAAPIHRVPSIDDMSRKQLHSRQQPQAERAGKPPHADGPSTSTWIGKENAYTGRIRCESPSQKVFHKALPVVPTLGGARKDLPSAQAG
ncbi:Ubiquitin carboxyl-terminal hydrolase family protein, partial [Aphelenchoides avenae]